jgi:hypothetical protein
MKAGICIFLAALLLVMTPFAYEQSYLLACAFLGGTVLSTFSAGYYFLRWTEGKKVSPPVRDEKLFHRKLFGGIIIVVFVLWSLWGWLLYTTG